MVLDACNVFPRTASILPFAGIKVSSLSFSAKNRLELGHFTAVLSTQANSIVTELLCDTTPVVLTAYRFVALLPRGCNKISLEKECVFG